MINKPVTEEKKLYGCRLALSKLPPKCYEHLREEANWMLDARLNNRLYGNPYYKEKELRLSSYLTALEDAGVIGRVDRRLLYLYFHGTGSYIGEYNEEYI